eukprot:g3566.t1
MRVFGFAFVLSAAVADGLLVGRKQTKAKSTSGREEKKPSKMTRKKCKVTCQRFGMKSLGPDFAGMTPQDCTKRCDTKFEEFFF